MYIKLGGGGELPGQQGYYDSDERTAESQERHEEADTICTTRLLYY